jgi:hypothetical protein
MIGIGALLIFLSFAKNNRFYKRIKAGPLEIEAKDGSGDAVDNVIKNTQKRLQNESQAIKGEVRKLAKKIDLLISEVDALSIDNLKLLFYATSQPIAERLLAGLKYVHKGKNGDMGKAVIKMALNKMEIYEAICVVKPEYKIPEIEKSKRGGDRWKTQNLSKPVGSCSHGCSRRG